jgi:hypothetical protein
MRPLLRSLGTLLLLLCACTPSSESPATIPAEPPYLSGAITAIEAGEIRVEADPGQASGSAKAMLKLTDETQILWRTGERADRGDLRLGTVVSAWVSGPILESYPVQATAATVVIESTTRPAAPQA